MNRLTALLLAMAGLLVHVLAIHRDQGGAKGGVFEVAHVAFRLGRNLVYEGVLAWNTSPIEGGLASYPSPLWVGAAAFAERLYWNVAAFSQLLGVLCVLIAVVLSTRFDTDRIAGVVPALLLVTSGSVAASGASGTEWPAAMLFLLTSFVALEHRRARISAVALTLLVAVRPEGALAALVLLIVALGTHRRGGARWPLRSFLPAFVVLVVLDLGGSQYPTLIADALSPDRERFLTGLRHLRDFLIVSVTPILLVFPIVAFLLRELSGVGRRALIIAGAWTLVIVLEGGGPASYGLALVPALPLVFIAVQQGIARALDTYRPSMERLSWTCLAVGIAGSILMSRFPGDLGPIPLERFHAQLLAASAPPRPGMNPVLGRAALHGEILHTNEMRRIGGFLRDELPKDASVLTLWPGAIGYLSGVRVIDFFGRTAPLPGHELRPWWPQWTKTDVRAAFQTRPDVVLPALITPQMLQSAPFVRGLPVGILGFDDHDGPELRADLTPVLEQYELITVPCHALGAGPRSPRRPLHLLRRKARGVRPALTLALGDGGLSIQAGFPAGEPGGPRLPQLVDLIVLVTDETGRTWPLNPAGRLVAGPLVAARVAFVLEPEAMRRTTLIQTPIGTAPTGAQPAWVEAWLVHTAVPRERPFAIASATQLLELGPR